MERSEDLGLFVFQIFSFKDFFCLNPKILMGCLGIVSIRLMLMKEKSFVKLTGLMTEVISFTLMVLCT